MYLLKYPIVTNFLIIKAMPYDKIEPKVYLSFIYLPVSIKWNFYTKSTDYQSIQHIIISKYCLKSPLA